MNKGHLLPPQKARRAPYSARHGGPQARRKSPPKGRRFCLSALTPRDRPRPPGRWHVMTATPDSDMWAAFPAEDAAPTVLPWDDPVPLKQRRELPPFPVDAFPKWLRDFTTALAEETQTPVDLGGCVALAVLATAAGGRAVVHVRGRWREPTNPFTVCALPPGNRKSAVFTAMTDPLYDAEKLLKERALPAIIEAGLTPNSPGRRPTKHRTRRPPPPGTGGTR
ncbi:DUF3987 domain-containing protein [Streptomyces polygonati]|uniref:DUF3987 domain-containing protein n=1 Tax=Streptomyces polygonati TaxID=1617087 RepID=A0ABV8HNX3_9ACTN